jgi:hypothetical protein
MKCKTARCTQHSNKFFEEIKCPSPRSVLGVRSRTAVYRSSDPLAIVELTVQPDETVEQAAMRRQKVEQQKLEEKFRKPVRSTDVQDF